jgi:NADPH2:quinone reductase
LDHGKAGYLDEAMKLTKGRGFDVIFEMLANVNLGKDLELLAPRGRVVVIGSRGTVEIDPRATMSRDAAILGMSLSNSTRDELAEIYRDIGEGLKRKTLRPIVGRELPLAQAPKAHVLVMEPGARGKIVLIP